MNLKIIKYEKVFVNCFLMVLGLSLNANSLTIINYTNCSFEISTQLPLNQILPNSTYFESNPDGIYAVKLIAEGTTEQINFEIDSIYVNLNGVATPVCNNNNSILYEWVVDTNTDDIILIIYP